MMDLEICAVPSSLVFLITLEFPLIDLQMRERYDLELNNLCQQLLALQASMLREQNRVEILLREKDALIAKQKVELEKANKPQSHHHNNVSVTSLSAGGGSLRIHGSFRQYKKDREKIRHFKTNSGDSGINISSEESSSSPTTLPRTQKQKSILKPVEFTGAQQESAGLTHLQQLIEQTPIAAATNAVAPVTAAGATSTKIQISPDQTDTKSDSGRQVLLMTRQTSTHFSFFAFSESQTSPIFPW